MQWKINITNQQKRKLTTSVPRTRANGVFLPSGAGGGALVDGALDPLLEVDDPVSQQEADLQCAMGATLANRRRHGPYSERNTILTVQFPFSALLSVLGLRSFWWIANNLIPG
ncbi:hypothetical protein VM1G_01578 [Cytospora mali]|uniref:Uncharacterized protein n=1 Tax=Cytospora mali TaxID=578113 RepID=A0A194VSU8_CYTMA|nr:hypothetical protein VM1G_01578 [Valsa mali]